MGQAMERKLYYSWWHSLGLLFYGGFSGLFCVCLICFALWVDRAVLSDISYWFLLLLTLFSWLFYWLQYAVVLPMLLLRKPVVRMDEQGIAVHDALNFFSKHRKWSAKWDNIRAVDVGMEALKKHHPYLGKFLRPRIGAMIQRRHVAYGEEHYYVVVSSGMMPGQGKGVSEAILAAWRQYKAGISNKIPYTAQSLYRMRQEDFANLIQFLDEEAPFAMLDLEKGVPTKHDLIYLYQFKKVFGSEKIKIHYNKIQRQLKITQEDGISPPRHLPAVEAELLRVVNLHLYD
jgi:hypothetical protein